MLLNEENPSEIAEVCCVEGSVLVRRGDGESSESIEGKRAPRPSGVSNDWLKCAGRPGIPQQKKSIPENHENIDLPRIM